MTIDDRYSDLPNVLQNVAHIMSQAHQQVSDELRSDEMNELIDTLSCERRQYRMWERLNSTHEVSSMELSSGTFLSQLTCQHACEDWLVLCDARFRFVIPTQSVLSVSGLGTRAMTREHHAVSCGLHVLANIAEVEQSATIILQSGENVTGQISAVWRDCVDIRAWHEAKTVPFHVLDCVRFAI